jgi:hypothetical protein
VTDPTSPEILAWLDTLPLRERLVTLHAMMFAIPTLQRTAARSRAKRLKEELAG